MKFGDKYNWKGQPERLVYLGRKGMWHQFARVETPHRVWCEVQEIDLHMLEPTPPQQIKENS
jgi:hypothetical protein